MNRILGVDLGTARIGLALSDELQMLAHPLETIAADKNALNHIAEVARARTVEAVVVGVPRTMSGEVAAAATEALAFIDKLKPLLSCPIVKWDERLTTVAAHRALREAGRKTRETRGYVDQVAAQLILQGYLDQKQLAAPPSPEADD